MKPRPVPGRPDKLTLRQRQSLTKILLEGPLARGHSTDLWTLKRISEVIDKQFDVSYRPIHVWKNIRYPQVISFLKIISRHFKKGFAFLWDRSATHKAKAVKRFIGASGRIYAYRFPGYAPELNPDEFVWADMKHAVANGEPKDTHDLKKSVIVQLSEVIVSLPGATAVARRSRSKPAAIRNWIPSLRWEQAAQSQRLLRSPKVVRNDGSSVTSKS